MNHCKTIDHDLSFKKHRKLTYDWDNYRFASSTLNPCRRNEDDAVLDLFEVGEGWSEIVLPFLQMRVTDAVPAA